MKSKKLSTIVLVFLLSLVTVFNSASFIFAAELETQKYLDEEIITGTISYPGDIGDVVAAQYFYSDGYFKNPSTEYNNHLSTMSMNFAMSSMNGNASVAKKLLNNIKCEDIKNLNLGQPTTEDTIGAVYGYKTIFKGEDSESILIPITVRGAFYGFESINNCFVGETGDSNGFDNAANTLFDTIQKYIKEKGISEEKAVFWITGYSRGATVANLLAKKLSDIPKIGKEDVYAYSFEAQRTAYNNKTSYPNLHVVSNYSDLLTVIIPSFSASDDFSYYGTETFIGDTRKKNYSDLEASMLEQLKLVSINLDTFYSPTAFSCSKINSNITGLADAGLIGLAANILSIISNKNFSILVKDNWSTKNNSLRSSEDLLIKRIKEKAVMSRAQYVSNDNRTDGNNKPVDINSASLGGDPYTLQDVLMAYFRLDESRLITPSLSAITDNFKNFPYKDYLNLENIKKARALLSFLTTLKVSKSVWGGNYGTMVHDIWNILNTSSGDYLGLDEMANQNIISPEFLKEIKRALPIAIYTLAAYTSRDIGQTTETLPTVISSYQNIRQAHYPEINLSWLRSRDTFYVENPIEEINPDPEERGSGGGSIVIPEPRQECLDGNHEWSTAYVKVVKRASFDSEGEIQHVCKYCSEKESVTVPKVTIDNIEKLTYNGKAQAAPEVVLRCGNEVLVEGQDYEITDAKKATSVGEHSAGTITLKGKYEGSKEIKYTISPKNTALKKLSSKKNALTLKWSKVKNKTSLKNSNAGYRIRYCTSSKFKSGVKVKKVKGYKTVSCTIKNLKAKKKYFVQIQTYIKVNNKTYYSSWSSSKKVTINK